MNKLKISLLVLIAVCGIYIACSQNSEPKGKLFIIGGGDRTEEIMKRLVSESGLDKGGYAVVLPMSSEEPDTSFYYTWIDFKALGCNNVYKLFCTKEQANNPAKADSVLNAKVIYITGGDQSRFMAAVEGSAVLKSIREAFKNGSMIAGTSAGAAVMSHVMITGNALKKDTSYSATFNIIEEGNTETKEGLGVITTAIIDQHFVKRSRHNRLISSIIEHPELKGIGIDESTAILVKGSDAEVVGESQVLVFANPLKSKVVKNGKLSAKGLTLDMYLPGEHFSIK